MNCKHVFVLLLALAASRLPAQVKVYAGLGFNQSFMQVDSLNYVIDRYNATRTTEEELGQVTAPRGLAVQVGAVLGRFVLDLGYTQRGQLRRSREAEQADGTYFVRELRFRAHTFDVGGAYKLNASEDWLLSLGASLDFGSVRVFTRYGRNTDYRQTPLRSPIMNELTLGGTIFVHASFPIDPDLPLHVFIRPYFQYDLYANEYGPVNRNLNFQTYLDDPPFLVSPAHNAGLKIGLVFYGG